MKPHVLVIGSSNTDMIVKVPDIPKPGETILGNDFFIIQGGKGANQAVAAARAGGNVTFLACIGNDDFGKAAIEAYKKEGINTDYIKRTDETSTGVALINVAQSGENSIAVAPGANALLRPEDLRALDHVFQEASIVLIQLETPLETVKEALMMAKKHNIRAILNPAPAQVLDKDILEMVAFLTPNEHEAALLAEASGTSDNIATLAQKLRAKGVNNVIITLGAEGVYYENEQNSRSVKGLKVNAIDTTAAGDTFNGYLATLLASGKSLEEAIQLANKAAAISVTKLGAQPSIPHASEV
ncbi:MAG: ribokinase [Bacteroidota bacterium]